jgi:hypothetical protein
MPHCPEPGKKRAAAAEADKAAPGKENKKKVAKKAKAAEPEAAEPEAAEPMATDAPAEEEDDVKPTVGSGRQAAQNVQYKDKDTSRARKDEIIVAEDEPEADSEAAGIRETQGERPSTTRRWVRRAGWAVQWLTPAVRRKPLVVAAPVAPLMQYLSSSLHTHPP